MTSDWRRRGVRPLAAALAVAWALAAGPGLCGSDPEPLQNRRQDQANPVSPGPDAGQADAPASVTVTGSGGNQEATVVVTPPVVGIGGVVVPDGGAAVPDGRTAPVAPGGLKDGQAVPAVPGGQAVPGGLKDGRTTPLVPGSLKDGQAAPDAVKAGTLPADKAKENVPNVTATGKGGDQNTKVLVAPQGTTPVLPAGPGKGEAVPGKGLPATPAPAEPIAVGPGGKVVDAAGRSVATPPGQAVTLPQGGKIIDAAGNVTTVPPGGQVIAPERLMTPGDFLPKANDKPEAGKKPGQDTAKEPAPEPKKPGAVKPQGKPQASLSPDKPGKPPDKEPPPAKAAVAKPGERIKIPEDACRKHSLDFLAGCWRGQVTMQDRTGVTIRLCFNEAGSGKRMEVYSRNGKKCSGATRASWGGEGLSFSFDKIYCSDGRVGTDVPIVCKGCGDNTHCVGTEYKGSTPVGKTNFEIVRE